MKTRPRKTTPPLSPSEQWNNFCEAMAEQELLEAGVFPNAKDAAAVHKELEHLANEITADKASPKNSAWTARMLLPGGPNKDPVEYTAERKLEANGKPRWVWKKRRNNRLVRSSDLRERPAAERPEIIVDQAENKPSE